VFNTCKREQKCLFNTYTRGTVMFVQYIHKGNSNVCSIHTQGEQQCLFNTYTWGTAMFVQYIHKGNSNVCSIHTQGKQ
jgi:hypothetical protein